MIRVKSEAMRFFVTVNVGEWLDRITSNIDVKVDVPGTLEVLKEKLTRHLSYGQNLDPKTIEVTTVVTDSPATTEIKYEADKYDVNEAEFIKDYMQFDLRSFDWYDTEIIKLI